MNARRFYIETHGCQMNVHDSEKIAGLLAHRGMTAVHTPEEADLFILNTCSVREKAAHKVYSRLGELQHRKREDPRFLIGVVGCVAQQESEEMVKRAPYVDMVVGTHMYHAIPDLLDDLDARQTASSSVLTRFLKDPSPVEIDSIVRDNAFRANITIMEGCNKHCAFCIVPHTRGKERSRPSRFILDEIRKAVDQGYFEILLLGQTVNSYKDPERRHYRFADLLSDCARLAGLKRIRFTSPHPRHFTPDVIDVIASSEKICNQVHLPLQSGSSRVLRAMRRQHDREWYLSLVDQFRRCGRQIAFSTDLIVGFPGETEADFEQTLSMLREVEYETAFSFKYSRRPYTEAYNWEEEVPEEEKTRRLMILQRLQREIQLRLHHERYLGRVFEVVAEGPSRDGENYHGRTTTNKVVNFSGAQTPGAVLSIRVTEVGPNSFYGDQVPNWAWRFS